MARTKASMRRGWTRSQIQAHIDRSSFAGNAWKRIKSGFYNVHGSKVSPAPLTYQKDSTTTYRRRRAPRRVRRRARRFARRALSNNLRELAKQTLFYNTTTTNTFNSADNNVSLAVAINTGGDESGSVTSPNSDLYRIMILLKAYYGSTFVNPDSGFKFYIDSVRLEVTIRVVNPPNPIYLDVYDFEARKDCHMSASTLYDAGFNNSVPLPTSGAVVTTVVTEQTPGANPFLQSTFGTYCTITKCTRYNFDTDKYISIERRYNKNQMCSSDRIILSGGSQISFNPVLGGLTRGMLFVFRRDVTGTSPGIVVQSFRTYNIKYLAGNQGSLTSVQV